jgi:hypothetical protein
MHFQYMQMIREGKTIISVSLHYDITLVIIIRLFSVDINVKTIELISSLNGLLFHRSQLIKQRKKKLIATTITAVTRNNNRHI